MAKKKRNSIVMKVDTENSLESFPFALAASVNLELGYTQETTLGKSPSALKCLGIDLSNVIPSDKETKRKKGRCL